MDSSLYLIDGYALIYRSYFAFINRPLTDRDGNNVSAVHGFFRALFALKRDYKVEHLAVAMDPREPTFRHKMYPEYKANRDAAPEDLHAQVPLIEEILGHLGIPVFMENGYEADDVMGSLARICRERNRGCYLVSSDKDLLQLVEGPVKMLRPVSGGGFKVIGPEEVYQDKGVRPDQIIDYLALIGDSSDNIPGVSGIGPKTASALLKEWGTLDNIYLNLDKAVKGSKLEKLKAGRENAYLSKKLVTIITGLSLEKQLDNVESVSVDFSAAAEMFRERDMKSLVKEAEKLMDAENRSSSPDIRVSTSSRAPGPVNRDGYKIILSDSDMEEWYNYIISSSVVAVDTETDSLDALNAHLAGVSFAVEEGKAAYMPLRNPEGKCVDREKAVKWLNKIFSDKKIKIIGQNFKFDLKVFYNAGVTLPEVWFDTMIAAWVLDASSPVGMDALAERYLGVKTIKFNDVVPGKSTFDQVPLDKAAEYAAEDADITLRLYKVFSELLDKDPGRSRIFNELEMPLLPILTSMEITGIGLDIFELEAYAQELEKSINHLVNEIYLLCGHDFNISSPKQLQKVLFEERGLTPRKKTKTGYSTDNSVLMELAAEDPLPEKILLYRSLTKLKSTYVDVLPKLVSPKDGRIHTTYSQTGAATGRLSSNNPNLQNIPIRDENGRRIRRAFKSREGYTFVSADYSQIELVVLAHLSGDEALSEAFRNNRDVHSRTASLLFGTDSREVTSEQRRMAKAINFGVIYGMSAFRLSNELKISRKEAKHFIDTYFSTYSSIKKFVEESVSAAEEAGGIRTMFGRFRPLPGINSRNRVEKAASERAAVNSIIQGSAADIMKKAMINVFGELAEKVPEASIILQVHDEILIETPAESADKVMQLTKNAMESAVKLNVPLKVNMESAESWGDIH